MAIDWEFTAQSFMDQLAPANQSRVLYAVERLRGHPPEIDAAQIQQLPTVAGGEEYLLRVGDDLRVVFQRNDYGVRIVDVFRRSQLEGIGQLQLQD
jgi:hypothetical protein